MFLGWTTVGTLAEADRLASEVIERRLAVCVQIDGPVISHYRWEGKINREPEFRLLFKFLPETAQALETHVLSHHPYATPEWIVTPAARVGEKYLSWAKANSSNPPL